MAMGLMFAACVGKFGASGDVKDYALYFIEKLKANQVDSLAKSYPDILNADSLVDLSGIDPEKIEVNETGPGFYEIVFSPEVKLIVKRSDSGKIQVMESYGVFAYPQIALERARSVGMLTDDVSDVTLRQRFYDEEFVEWLLDKTFESAGGSVSLTPGRASYQSDYYSECVAVTLPVTVKNNGSTSVSGSSYNIVYTEEYPTCSDGSSPNGYSQHTRRGVDLEPGESQQITLREGCAIAIRNPRIEFTETREEYFQNNFEPTGKEYQEYLSSKNR